MGVKKIQSLIKAHQELVFKKKIHHIPSDYAQLQTAAITEDLQWATEKLSALFFNPNMPLESMKPAFLALCKEREEQNRNSFLSYTASPENIGNELYFQIAVILFKPQTFSQLINILMPSLTTCLTIEVHEFLEPKINSALLQDRVRISLKNNPIEKLSDYPAALSEFMQVIIDENKILTIKTLESFPIFIHLKLYKLLEEYPALQQKLYLHNDDLKQLKLDMELIENTGKTPNERLTHFANELIRSGVRYTGSTYASNSAIVACKQFCVYLDHLPSTLRKELLALQTLSGKHSLHSILEDHLEKGNCVELAAALIKEIQANSHNITILNKTSSLSEEQIHHVKIRYRGPIKITGYEQTKALPERLKPALLENILIASTHDYIDLLINLAPNEYSMILEHANIVCDPALPDDLKLITEMLSEEQKKAFFDAVIRQKKKLGGSLAILTFAVKCNSFYLFNEIFKLLPNHTQLNLINKKNESGYTLLGFATLYSSIEIWRLIWDVLPDQDRINQNNKDTYGSTLLHYASQNNDPAILNAILTFLPKSIWLPELSAENNRYDTPLYFAIRNINPEFFYTVWKKLGAEERRAIAKVKINNLTTLLQLAAAKCHPDVWQTLWEFYSEEVLIDLRAKGRDGFTLLHYAASGNNLNAVSDILKFIQELPHFPDCKELDLLQGINAKSLNDNTPVHVAIQSNQIENFKAIWMFLSPSAHLALLDETNKSGKNVLHLAVTSDNQEIFYTIWNSLSNQERWKMTTIKTANNLGLLQLAAEKSHPDVWKTLWEFYSEQASSIPVKDKDRENDFVLPHLAARNDLNPNVMRDILKFLIQSNQLSVMDEKSRGGSTPLHFAITNTKVFYKTWKYLPDSARFAALSVTNYDGLTLLDYAVQHKNPENFHLILGNLSGDERKQIIKNDNNLLLLAAEKSHPDVWKTLWKFYCDEGLIDIEKKDKGGRTLIHCAILNSYPFVIRDISNYIRELSGQNKLDPLLIINAKNSHGHTPLYLATFNNKVDNFRVLWSLLSESDRLVVLQEKKNDDEYIFFLAVQQHPDIFHIIWQSLSKDGQQAIANIKNENGSHLLQYAAQKSDLETWWTIWEFYTEEERYKAIKEKTGNNQYTLLHWTIRHSNLIAIRTILLFAQDPLEVINTTDKDGNTALHLAVKQSNLQAFLALFESLSESNRLIALSIKDIEGKTTLHLAAKNNLKIFNTCWKFLLLKSDPLTLISDKNELGVTALHYAIQNKNPDVFLTIWNRLSHEERRIAAKMKSGNGSTLLEFAIQESSMEAWKIIWNFYLDEELIAINIQEKSKDTSATLLHRAVSNSTEEVICDILGYITKSNQLSLLTEKNKDGNMPFHLAMLENKNKKFNILWQYSPKQVQLTAIKERNNDGKSLLGLASLSPSIFEMLWNSSSHTEQLTALNVKDNDNNSLLHAVSKRETCFNIIWKDLSAQERLAAIKEINKDNKTPLRLAGEYNYPIIFNSMLKSFTDDEQFKLIKEMIFYAAQLEYYCFIQIILDYLPVEKRLSYLIQKNHLGNSPLHLAAKNKNSAIWQTIMKYLPEQDRAAAIKDKNAIGSTPLHIAAENSSHSILDMMMETLPPSEHLQAITDRNQFGNSPLHRASKNANPEIMTKMLSHLSGEKCSIALSEDRKIIQERISGSTFTTFGAPQRLPAEEVNTALSAPIMTPVTGRPGGN